jgi:hypothetical protein
MSNNPWAGAVPLNYRQGTEEEVAKSTSYRPGKVFPVKYRTPDNDRTIAPRNEGCTLLRRYPNGVLDIDYVVGKIIDIIHKMKDGGATTQIEKALLTLVLPNQFKKLIDPKIAQTVTKLSNDERLLLALKVNQHKREELNWNVGQGGGSVEGRSSTRS